MVKIKFVIVLLRNCALAEIVARRRLMKTFIGSNTDGSIEHPLSSWKERTAFHLMFSQSVSRLTKR
jgi:hypothetical protein